MRKQAMALVTVNNPAINEHLSSPDTPSPLLSPSSSDDTSTSTSTNGTAAASMASLPKAMFRKMRCFITIEPMLLLQMVAMSSTAINVQSFYIETICRKTYFNDTDIDCANLTFHKHEEEYVEGQAAIYSTYKNLIEAGVPIIFSLFLGPWSDKHGSKIPMVIPLIGYTISAFLYYIFSYMENLEPALLLLASVPVALSGGMIAFVLSAFRYVASITSTETRSFRIAVAEGSWFLGSPIGLLGSAYLLKIGGYSSIFVACIVMYGLALVYVIIFVKTDRPELDSASESSMIRDMFNIEAVKDTVHTCFRKRAGSKRLWIILLIITICLRILTLFGSMNVTLLYTRESFGWDNAIYSTYTTIDGILGITGSSVVAILGMRVFHIQDSTIGVFSAASYLGGSIIWAMASESWMMYLGATVQMFCGLISIMIRSILSKLVPKDELGKVYSFVASGEAAMPIIAAPLYNLVYRSTVSTFPGTVYVMSSGFNLIILLCFIYFFISFRRQPMHDEMEEEIQTEPVIAVYT